MALGLLCPRTLKAACFQPGRQAPSGRSWPYQRRRAPLLHRDYPRHIPHRIGGRLELAQQPHCVKARGGLLLLWAALLWRSVRRCCASAQRKGAAGVTKRGASSGSCNTNSVANFSVLFGLLLRFHCRCRVKERRRRWLAVALAAQIGALL